MPLNKKKQNQIVLEYMYMSIYIYIYICMVRINNGMGKNNKSGKIAKMAQSKKIQEKMKFTRYLFL